MGYLRRWRRGLTADLEVLEAERLEADAEASGVDRGCDCRVGDVVVMLGTLQTVTVCAGDGTATVVAELFDGTDIMTLVWLGRRSIPGIDAGRTLLVRGRVSEGSGRRTIFNPWFELRRST